jgi:hypothetical protein
MGERERERERKTRKTRETGRERERERRVGAKIFQALGSTRVSMMGMVG